MSIRARWHAASIRAAARIQPFADRTGRISDRFTDAFCDRVDAALSWLERLADRISYPEDRP